MFLLQNDLSGILNYYTFTMVPSMINENVKKNVLFHWTVRNVNAPVCTVNFNSAQFQP
jgi:hypothetical protein